VRKTTQVIMGALTLGSVVTGVQLGSNAKPQEFVPSPLPTDKPTTEPTPSATPTNTPAPKPQPQVSRTSDAISYRYGVVQLTVVKSGSTITDIRLDQATATNGRSAAFNYLVQVALQAQSANFDSSMLTGATFTVDAFTQALTNALNQF
jgi:uncharacterized protein with FMN-binding domain